MERLLPLELRQMFTNSFHLERYVVLRAYHSARQIARIFRHDASSCRDLYAIYENVCRFFAEKINVMRVFWVPMWDKNIPKRMIPRTRFISRFVSFFFWNIRKLYSNKCSENNFLAQYFSKIGFFLIIRIYFFLTIYRKTCSKIYKIFHKKKVKTTLRTIFSKNIFRQHSL